MSPPTQIRLVASHPIARWIAQLTLWLLVFALVVFAVSGCQTGAQTQIVAYVDAGDALAARFDVDSQTIFARAQVDARAGLYSKFSQAPFFFGDWKAGTVRVASRAREFEQEYQPGEPLPAWLLATGIFLPGDVERWGLTFEPDVPPVTP